MSVAGVLSSPTIDQTVETIPGPLARKPSWKYGPRLSLTDKVVAATTDLYTYASNGIDRVSDFLQHSRTAHALRWTGIPYLARKVPEFLFNASVRGVLPRPLQERIARDQGDHPCKYTASSLAFSLYDKFSELLGILALSTVSSTAGLAVGALWAFSVGETGGRAIKMGITGRPTGLVSSWLIYKGLYTPFKAWKRKKDAKFAYTIPPRELSYQQPNKVSKAYHSLKRFFHSVAHPFERDTYTIPARVY